MHAHEHPKSEITHTEVEPRARILIENLITQYREILKKNNTNTAKGLIRTKADSEDIEQAARLLLQIKSINQNCNVDLIMKEYDDQWTTYWHKRLFKEVHERSLNNWGKFSEGRMWVSDPSGIFHLKPDGSEAYKERYDDVGYYHKGKVWVKKGEKMWQIDYDGSRMGEGWNIVTDYGSAVYDIRNNSGEEIHINIDEPENKFE